MQKQTRINPLIHQELLESATNAAAKGQAQYFTPVPWAKVLALPLPDYRQVICDLACGNGQLLMGSVGHHTPKRLLGCDIDPDVDEDARKLPWSGAFMDQRVTADITNFSTLLRAVQFEADLFVLNPPWDMHWHRDRFTALADSACRAVADAYAAHDGRTGKDAIDSTVATLCLALDLCSSYGEGLLIANEATLQRLIFALRAPHRALLNHIWAHVVIDGNICAAKYEPDSGFKTGVVYFARSPQSGTPAEHEVGDLAGAQTVCADLHRQRLKYRRGCEAEKDYAFTKETPQLWAAAAEEWRRVHGERKAPQWNIRLDLNGLIRTDLSLFDQHCGKINKGEVARLFALNGRSPMSLVIQKAHRKELERAAFGDTWRVAPAVQDAVRTAMKQYDAVRAPLRALNKIQRLGYLDEQDEIRCDKDLSPRFTAGKNYLIRTLTISVRRAGEKMNLSGELDEVEWTGSELCIFITDNDGVERSFMEARLRDKAVKLSLHVEDLDDDGEEKKVKIDYTLQQLVAHFIIPDVPDVATLAPELYQRNVDLLHEIESIIA
jgi:predicted RNA methylase